MSTILTLYSVKKVIGPDGKEIIPGVGLNTGLAWSVDLCNKMNITKLTIIT